MYGTASFTSMGIVDSDVYGKIGNISAKFAPGRRHG